MIKTADIGVGIRGVEGTSAVANADYVVSQWRFLPRLLLGYGHLNYRRMALVIAYIFYKSSILVWTAYFLGAYSMYPRRASRWTGPSSSTTSRTQAFPF